MVHAVVDREHTVGFMQAGYVNTSVVWRCVLLAMHGCVAGGKVWVLLQGAGLPVYSRQLAVCNAMLC